VIRNLFLLQGLSAFSDHAIAAVRLLTGSFLIYGVWDNIVSAERMSEFVQFLAANGFPAASILAPLSVYAQFVIGIALLLGAATRWAGLLLAFNFTVGVIMVHWTQSFREWWPAIILVALGLLFATLGAGRFGVDRRIEEGR
jgi:putative oxidoreductase